MTEADVDRIDAAFNQIIHALDRGRQKYLVEAFVREDVPILLAGARQLLRERNALVALVTSLEEEVIAARQRP